MLRSCCFVVLFLCCCYSWCSSCCFVAVDDAVVAVAKLFLSTVKPVCNDYPLDPEIVAVADSWSLFKGSFFVIIIENLKMGPKNDGHCRQTLNSKGNGISLSK